MLLCKECEGKETCIKLCKAAELYVNQDNVNQNTMLLGDNDNFIEDQEWPDFYATPEVIIRMYFKEHKRGLEIAKKLKVSHQYVYKVIKQFKPIYAEKTSKNAVSTPII